MSNVHAKITSNLESIFIVYNEKTGNSHENEGPLANLFTTDNLKQL